VSGYEIFSHLVLGMWKSASSVIWIFKEPPVPVFDLSKIRDPPVLQNTESKNLRVLSFQKH
jgi:hypothetical protein